MGSTVSGLDAGRLMNSAERFPVPLPTGSFPRDTIFDSGAVVIEGTGAQDVTPARHPVAPILLVLSR